MIIIRYFVRVLLFSALDTHGTQQVKGKIEF